MYPALLNICLLAVVNLVRGDDVQLLSSALSGFSQQLYQKLALNESNSVYSPYSIHSALAMTLVGARGETATELSKTLGLTALTGNSAHLAYRNLIVQLNNATEVKLYTANALYANPSIPLDAQFVKDVTTNYFAKSSNFDLAAVGGPEKEINDFVENKTEGLIKDILEPESINDLTVAVLINTIFFNGTWLNEFSENKTQKQNFQQLSGAKSQVDMMNDERYVSIKRNVSGVDVAELLFVDKRFSLYIALPQEVDGVTDLESSLAMPGKLDQLFQGLTDTRVRLSIPKFKLESKFQLSAALQQLGIVKAFDPKSANFQGIRTAGDVHINDVFHKAVIEVLETGTVAAAATAIKVGATAVPEPPSETFIADHSFLFFLLDKLTNVILFQGKFTG